MADQWTDSAVPKNCIVRVQIPPRVPVRSGDASGRHRSLKTSVLAVRVRPGVPGSVAQRRRHRAVNAGTHAANIEGSSPSAPTSFFRPYPNWQRNRAQNADSDRSNRSGRTKDCPDGAMGRRATSRTLLVRVRISLRARRGDGKGTYRPAKLRSG
jgi:hypothetical protein